MGYSGKRTVYSSLYRVRKKREQQKRKQGFREEITKNKAKEEKEKKKRPLPDSVAKSLGLAVTD